MQNEFYDKTVIITGASSGLGAAAARLFAAAGARLVLVARRSEPLETLAASLGSGHLVVAMNVADDDACRQMLAQAHQEFGRTDVLVNNAACNYRGPVVDLKPQQLTEMVEVNLRAPVLLSRLVIPYLQQSGGGAIVNVTSLAGKIPVAYDATYSATKFGLRAFSRALGDELRGKGISVSCVSPGPIDTGFIMEHIDAVPDYVFSQPVSSAHQVAQLVFRCAVDGKTERSIPVHSGLLATAGYLFPPLAALLRPLLARKGRRSKQRYQEKYRNQQD